MPVGRCSAALRSPGGRTIPCVARLTGRLLAAVLLVTVAVAAGGADPARACSCVRLDAAAQLKKRPAAFIGRLVRVVPDRPGDRLGRATFRYRVLRAVKGPLGRGVSVRSVQSDGACGLPDRRGRRYALFLMREGRRWTSNLCLTTSVGAMLRAAGGVRSTASACPPS